MRINKPKVFKNGDKVWIKNDELIHRGWGYIIERHLPNNKIRLSSTSGLGRIIEVCTKHVFLID